MGLFSLEGLDLAAPQEPSQLNLPIGAADLSDDGRRRCRDNAEPETRCLEISTPLPLAFVHTYILCAMLIMSIGRDLRICENSNSVTTGMREKHQIGLGRFYA